MVSGIDLPPTGLVYCLRPQEPPGTRDALSAITNAFYPVATSFRSWFPSTLLFIRNKESDLSSYMVELLV